MLLGTSKIMLSRWLLHMRGLRRNVGSPKLRGHHFSSGSLVPGTSLYAGESTAKTHSEHISLSTYVLSIFSLWDFRVFFFVFPVVTSLFLRCSNYLLIPHKKRQSKCLASQLAACPWMAFCLNVDLRSYQLLARNFCDSHNSLFGDFKHN